MKAIVTRQNKDGSFDELGTNNRYVSAEYKTERNLIRFNSHPGIVYRYEFYHQSIQEAKPFKVIVK